MEILQVVMTAVLFALLVIGIVKKINLPSLLLGLSILGLIYLTAVNGSVLGDKTTGSPIIDIFTYIENSMVSSMGGIVFILMIVIAFVSAMNSIKASDVLVNILVKVVKGIRVPFVLIAVTIIVAALLRIPITMGPAVAALVIATLYPVLLKIGAPKPAAAAAVILGALTSWGPADASVLMVMELAGITDASVAELFVSSQVPLIVVYLIALCVGAIIWWKFFTDKKSKAEIVAAEEKLEEDKGEDVKYPPAYYAILPLLPVILLIIFSPICIASVKMSIVTATLISLIIALIVHLITQRSFKALFDMLKVFYESYGNTIISIGILVMFAILFAAIQNTIGGMAIIASGLVSLNMPMVLLVLILVLFSAVVNAVVGSFYGTLAICVPIAAQVAALTGMDVFLLAFLVLTACGMGCACSPVNPVLLLVSQESKTDPAVLIKHNVAPAIFSLVVVTIFGVLFFG